MGLKGVLCFFLARTLPRQSSQGRGCRRPRGWRLLPAQVRTPPNATFSMFLRTHCHCTRTDFSANLFVLHGFNPGFTECILSRLLTLVTRRICVHGFDSPYQMHFGPQVASFKNLKCQRGFWSYGRSQGRFFWSQDCVFSFLRAFDAPGRH